jgi:dihydrofolate synthase/folylpolyglutamate synthase
VSSPAKSDLVLERLNRLHPKIIDLDLRRVVRLLSLVGHPEEHLPPVIHVAGTNGKGSVIAFLRAMLEHAGYRVHVYTSPHLVRFHERIRLAGSLIAEEELIDLLVECEKANGGDAITFFEITTVAAYLAFTRHPGDILLLETGLGGRLDATNVIERPLATIITSISMDHMQHLGDTIEKIASEKAGIIKRGCPVIVGPQSFPVGDILASVAHERHAPLWRHDHEWDYVEAGSGLRYEEAGRILDLPAPVLAGRHQFANAATAVAATRWLAGFEIGPGEIKAGLLNAIWPARLQRLRNGPLIELMPAGWELWLDGGHNEDAGKAIAGALLDWRRSDDTKVSLVFGMLNTKEPLAFLKPLAPLVEDLSAVAIPGDHAALSAAEGVRFAGMAGIAAKGFDSARAALSDLAQSHGQAPRRVLICGSLYLAGTILAENG